MIKTTFSKRSFDWILIITTLYLSIENSCQLFNKFDFFSSYLLRITFASVSIIAFFSLLIKKANGERYSRLFIFVSLLTPGILIFNQWATDYLIYGINRTELLRNFMLPIQFIVGIILFILTLKYSRQTKLDHTKDYSFTTILLGTFLLLYFIVRAIEPLYDSELNSVSMTKIFLKPILSLLIIYFGCLLNVGKIKLSKSVWLTLLLWFIYGLV